MSDEKNPVERVLTEEEQLRGKFWLSVFARAGTLPTEPTEDEKHLPSEVQELDKFIRGMREALKDL